MALPESLMMSLEQWMTTFNSVSDLWTNELFNLETETLAKALQISLSSGSETLANAAAEFDENASFQYGIDLPEMESLPAPASASASTSGSDPESLSPANRRQSVLSSVSNRKIAKRKSRGAKRSSTTFIAADPANFRQMVQQVTGKRFADGGNAAAAAAAAAAEVLRPAAHRPSEWMLQSCHLPTLDTSALLLKNQLQVDASVNKPPPPPPPQHRQRDNRSTVLPDRHVAFAGLVSGGAGFDGMEKYHQSFPTLESGGVM
ncbi:hypothetical protein Scep_003141 [Stephania cephalantha]|uniref:VQ domain-containing protein n=1 Tax=Stephania cephalantha TaxID=152367 RepID=A0AAP0KPY2_9MAGN